MACTCSVYQLAQVGCDCGFEEVITIKVWPRGYAHEDGLTTVKLPGNADVDAELRKRFGSFFKVWSRHDTRDVVRPVEPVSEEYARMMSRNDNS